MSGNPLQSASSLRARSAQAGAGAVRVICGVHVLEVALAGRAVGDVRAALSQALNISPEAVAVVDGMEVGSDHVLQAGEQVEFVRLAGEKGWAPGRRPRPRARSRGPEGRDRQRGLRDGAG